MSKFLMSKCVKLTKGFSSFVEIGGPLPATSYDLITRAFPGSEDSMQVRRRRVVGCDHTGSRDKDVADLAGAEW